jgi:hypothetical protein
LYLAVLSIAVGSAPGHADEASDRESAIREIEGYLKEMASYVSRARDDSSMSNLDSAIDRADRLKSKIRDLERVKGSDSRANKIVSDWPGYADKFREATAYLKQMKAVQLAQQDDKLWQRCEETDRKLREEIDRYVRDRDPEGLTRIPELAESYGRKPKEDYDRDKNRDSDMGSWHRYPDGFRADDGWNDVASNLRSGASGVLTIWRERLELSRQKCEHLVRLRNHPAVDEGVKKLGDHGEMRRRLYEELGKQLDEATNQLKSVPDSSDTDLSRLDSIADSLRRNVDALKEIRGKDRTAIAITDSWPGHISKYQESIKHLRRLKQHQRILDRGPQKCRDDVDTLKRKIAEYGADRAEEGLTEITKLATELGTDTAGKLRVAEAYRSEVERMRDDTKRFDVSDGNWSQVRSAMHAAADGTLRYFTDKHAEVKKECEDLAKGVGHPMVAEARRKLIEAGGAGESELKAVAEAYEQWKKDKRGSIGLWYSEDTAELRNAICNYKDSEELRKEGEEKLKAITDEIANRSANRLGSKVAELDQRAGALIDRLNTIKGIDSSSIGKERTRLRSRIVAARKRLNETKALGLLKGANNPQLRARLEYGKTMHKSLQDNCDAAEVPIGGFIDCVKVSSKTCTIIEIKPNNDWSKSKGEEQLVRYVKAVERKFRDEGAKGFTDKSKVFLQCIDGDRIDLATKLQTYDFCPSARDLTEEMDQAED